MSSPLRSDAVRNRALVIAAATEMRRRGEPLQLNGVARAAGVGVGTVYRHFATTEELAEVLVRDRFDDLETRVRLIRDEAELRSFLAHALTVFVQDDDFAAVATNPTPALDSTREAHARLLGALTTALEAAPLRDRLSPDLEPADVLLLLCATAYAVRRGRSARRDSYLDAFLRGVLPVRGVGAGADVAD